MLDIGQDAPDFTLVDAKGDSHRLADALAGGPVVLAFMKTSCGTCTLAFPYLERLHQAYPTDRWKIWGICQDPARAVESFAGQTGVTFPMLIDGDHFPVSQAYDPPATPTIFFVARQCSASSRLSSRRQMTGHQTSNLVEGHATRAGLARTDETNHRSAPPTPPGAYVGGAGARRGTTTGAQHGGPAAGAATNTRSRRSSRSGRGHARDTGAAAGRAELRSGRGRLPRDGHRIIRHVQAAD